MIKYLDWLHARGYPTEDEVVLLDRGPGANKGQPGAERVPRGRTCVLSGSTL